MKRYKKRNLKTFLKTCYILWGHCRLTLYYMFFDSRPKKKNDLRLQQYFYFTQAEKKSKITHWINFWDRESVHFYFEEKWNKEACVHFYYKDTFILIKITGIYLFIIFFKILFP